MEKELDEEPSRFLKEGPTAEEVARVKAQHEASFVRGIERIEDSKSGPVGAEPGVSGKSRCLQDFAQESPGCHGRGLKAAANRWLSDGVYVLRHAFPITKRQLREQIGPNSSRRCPN